jgi:tryptophan halogenase
MSLHFDAHKVGNYFKMLCENKVKIIDAKVIDVIVSPSGFVQELKLDNDQLISGDFFIDASGFARLIMNKIDVRWKSCKEYLPVNTAMPFILQHKENEEIIPETKATALSSGWMWNIPLTTRRGCGYVFDSNFITQDQAKQEVEKYLGTEIEPIKFINFDSGYLENFWKNNVIAIGLSSSFFEPLQATSIHNTILQVFAFVNYFLRDTIIPTIDINNIKIYNQYINELMEASLNLISLNYQGKKTNSDFWKSIYFENKVTEETKNVIEIFKEKFASQEDINITGHGFGLIKYNAAGLGLISQKLAYDNLIKNNKYEFAEKEYDKYYRAFSYKKI